MKHTYTTGNIAERFASNNNKTINLVCWNRPSVAKWNTRDPLTAKATLAQARYQKTATRDETKTQNLIHKTHTKPAGGVRTERMP